jgi:3-dehydroquinate synthase
MIIEKQGKSSIFFGPFSQNDAPNGEEGEQPFQREDFATCFKELPTALAVFSQDKIWEHHGTALLEFLAPLKIPTHLHILPDREECKTMAELNQSLEFMVEKGCDRHSAVIAFGGGTVGDHAGFAAATFMRGIPWFYIPTTLLAMQDASVGGKVAVNLRHGKNLAGAFWQPGGVCIDFRFLNSLPPREFVAGSMEWVKHAVLKGTGLYTAIHQFPDHFVEPVHAWAPLARRGVSVKIKIVDKDYLEHGLRKTLNLGHTLAHALEKITNYRFLHGEAVGLGLIFACILGNELGASSRWDALFQWIMDRLPMEMIRTELQNNPETRKILNYTAFDKKKNGHSLTWIIPVKPGQIQLREDVDNPTLNRALTVWKRVLGLF